MDKRTAKLVQQYNQRHNLLVISEYARYRDGATGLASFSRHTVESLLEVSRKQGERTKVVVLADRREKEEIVEDDDRLLIRCIKRNSWRSLFALAKYATRFSRVNNMVWEFEFASYGGIRVVCLFPLLLLYLRSRGKRVYFVMHQVVVDLTNLAEHLGVAKRSVRLQVLQQGLRLFYRIVGLFANKIVVLEEEFKARLTRCIAADKIAVISHGVPQVVPQKTRREYRRQLQLRKNDFVLLVFGYVTWYKGTDRLIEVFRRLPQRIAGCRLKLIIAGGRSNAQAGKAHYEKFMRKVGDIALKDKRVVLTGFVPEEEIEKYYLAADVCFLPYREFISSSGPLSLALAYRKPVLFSRELAGYGKSADFRRALRLACLRKQDLFVNISPASVERAMKRVITEQRFVAKMYSFVELLGDKRSWEKLGKDYVDLIWGSREDKLARGYLKNYKFVKNI